MRNTIILLLLSIAVNGQAMAQSNELKKVARWMTGSFTSTRQHVKDTANYLDIRLHMTRVWENNPDGIWIYVEQSVAGFQDRPYRQRVYHLTQKRNGFFCSDIYTLNAPLRFANHPDRIEALHPDSLTQKDGCSVTLKRESNHYTGGTQGKNCPSDRKGATYATSKVILTKKRLISWDQGFNQNDEQVWGALNGGYIFEKER
jgi:CpeT protein